MALHMMRNMHFVSKNLFTKELHINGALLNRIGNCDVKSTTSTRFLCTSLQPPPLITVKPDIHFEELQKRCETKELFIFDVRSPQEIEECGKIPNSLHIDIFVLGHALMLSNEDFLAKFGVAKPAADAEVVTLCKKGLRARTAQFALTGAGYTNVRVYPGSYLDWIDNGGRLVDEEEKPKN